MADPLVLAIECGEKTVTRRPVKLHRPLAFIGGAGMEDDPECWGWALERGWAVLARGFSGIKAQHAEQWSIRCPYGGVDDRLWIRERARIVQDTSLTEKSHGPRTHVRLRYEASGDESEWIEWPSRLKPTPVGHCIANGVFREGARTIVEITRVGVERVQDITEEQARKEGFRPREPVGHKTSTARWQFQTTWEQVYGDSWQRNDWVWVIEFRVVVCKGIQVAA